MLIPPEFCPVDIAYKFNEIADLRRTDSDVDVSSEGLLDDAEKRIAGKLRAISIP